MNLIKSIFIFLAPAWLIFILVNSAIAIINSVNITSNFGVLLSVLPLLLFLTYIMTFKTMARTSEHLLYILVPSLLGYCIILYNFLLKKNSFDLINMMYSLSAFFITFLYIYWYSNNNRKISDKILNNKTLPEFSVYNCNGDEVSSEIFLGNKTLLFFHRGNWCPLCMAQIDEIILMYKEFEHNNIILNFISPQSLQNTEKLASKHNLLFNFYTDKKNKAAIQLGILHKFGLPFGFQAFGYDSDSVYPTVIALNAKGRIIYNNQTSNYRVRPEPESLLKIFQ